jgi:hypothetical protein
MCFYDSLDTSDPNDPDVIVKIDISNAFKGYLTYSVISKTFTLTTAN